MLNQFVYHLVLKSLQLNNQCYKCNNWTQQTSATTQNICMSISATQVNTLTHYCQYYVTLCVTINTLGVNGDAHSKCVFGGDVKFYLGFANNTSGGEECSWPRGARAARASHFWEWALGSTRSSLSSWLRCFKLTAHTQARGQVTIIVNAAWSHIFINHYVNLREIHQFGCLQRHAIPAVKYIIMYFKIERKTWRDIKASCEPRSVTSLISA